MPVPTQIADRLSTATPCILTFSKPMGKGAWTDTEAQTLGVPVRPERAVLRRDAALRAECFTARQSFTTNHAADAALHLASMLWDAGYAQLLVQTPETDLQVLRSPKRITVRSLPPSRTAWTDIASDRVKPRPLDPTRDGEVLHALDLAAADGTVLAAMADKYRQLNHLIEIALALDVLRGDEAVEIVDAGCGKAYLSLALVHVLRRMGRTVSLLGIDTNPHVIAHAQRVADALGQAGSRFVTGPIADVPEHVGKAPRSVLIALHACDTATDDALQVALRLQVDAMLVAPCCHHFVQRQLRKDRVPQEARMLLEDGITRERLGDLLTDTMRRDIVRAHGYDAHLEEFIALEHTLKNVLLKAERRRVVDVPDLTAVRDMATRWGAHPRLLELQS